MSLAKLFYAKNRTRQGDRAQASRQRRHKRLPGRRPMLFEPLEPRLLLSMTPAEAMLPELAHTVQYQADIWEQTPKLESQPAVVASSQPATEGSTQPLAGDDATHQVPVSPVPEPVPGAFDPGLLATQFAELGPQDTSAYPVPLNAVRPFGSLVYDPGVSGSFEAAGEVDTYGLNLDAGQTVTFGFLPADPSIRVQVEVLSPGGASLGVATASMAGEAVAVQTAPIAGGGTYSLVARSLEGAGTYTAKAFLNAVVETEDFGGPDNGTLAAAVDLAGSAVALGGRTDRLAALGRTDATEGAPDFYRFELTAGQVAFLALTEREGDVGARGLELELQDAAGALLTLGISDAENAAQAIRGLVASEAGTYYARVTGQPDTSYSLLVTRDSAFDLEPNSLASRAQLIGPADQVLGSLARTAEGAARLDPIRVAVLTQSYGGAAVNQLNNDSFFDFEAFAVPGSQIDTLDELATYDVVVLGDYSADPEMTTIAPVLRAWVEAGGGVVGTGWLIYAAGAATGTPAADIDAIIPVNTSVYYNYVQNPLIEIVDSSHHVTPGVANFNPGDWVEYSTGGVDPGATVLANAAGTPIVVAGAPGSGRSVWLGPIYAGTSEVNALRTGAPDQLLEQAVAWAARGGVDVGDHYVIQVNAGDGLVVTTSTPGDGAGEPVNDLDPLLEVYDPTGTLVASNNDGAADARNARIAHTASSSGATGFGSRL